MSTTIILQKITEGSRHLRGDREIDYTLLEEEYYSYEILYKDTNFDRFFVKIICSEYNRLYIAGGSIYNLLKIIENRYNNLLESKFINFEIGVVYHSNLKIVSKFDGYTGRYFSEERKTIKQEFDKLFSDKMYSDMGYSIEFKIVHS